MSTPQAEPSVELSLVDDAALRLQRHVKLVPEGRLGVVRRAAFFALLTWLPLVAWAFYTSRMLPGGVPEPLAMHFGVHVRFLIAVPALILGEAMAHRVSTTLIPYFLSSGVVPPGERGAFVRIVGNIARLRDRVLPWTVIIVLVIAWTILQPAATGTDAGHEAAWAESGDAGGLGFGGWWFLYVSRPIFAVLLVSWLWRLALVFLLLKRVASLPLSIVPTHPDGAGGLGFLKDLPKAFSLLAFATSAVVASRLAHEVIYHDATLQSLKVVLGGFVAMVIGICIAPLFAMVPRLAAAKRRALLDYGALVGEHGRLVRRRWILGEELKEQPVLQAPEVGPVADTLAMYDAVRRMRPVPFDKSTIVGLAVPTLIPIIALLSTQVPIKEVLKKILGALLAVILLLTAPSAFAQEVKAWQPLAPEGLPADFDWIRLKSDEWLKGKIVSLYDGTLEFDSDELGVHTFDFGDIKEIRTSKVVQVGFADREPVTGRLVVNGDKARIIAPSGETEVARADILTVVVGAAREIDYWSGYANVGGNIRSGNSDQIDYTARIGTARRSVKDRTAFDYIGAITRIDSVDTSNNHRVTLGWDRFLSKRLFVNIANLEWYRDPFQNVANRWTVGAGLGYQILDSARTKLSATAGPAWQKSDWDSVPPDGEASADSFALRTGLRLDHEITSSIDFHGYYNAFFTDEKSGTYTHHLDTGVSIDLIGGLDASLAWVWDRVQEPRPLSDGSFPKKDDTRLIFGLGWSF